MCRYVIKNILNNLHTTVFILIWWIHQHFSYILFSNPFSRSFSSSIHLLQIRFSIFMNKHVGTCQCINFTVILNTKKLRTFNFLCFVCLQTTNFLNHICHCFYKETTRTTTSIQYTVIFIHFKNAIHKICNMLRCKNLSRFRFFLISVELIEKDTHNIFTTPRI